MSTESPPVELCSFQDGRPARPPSNPIVDLAGRLFDEYNVPHACISEYGEIDLACPFFVPVQKLDGAWLHPSRLPLGGGWDGHCSAPGHEDARPSTDELHEFCNLGYATKCSRLPSEREFDAVRFSIARDQGSRLVLWFVCEAGHRPVKHGTLEYDLDRTEWVLQHPDQRIQKMLDCYVQAYLQRRIQPVPTDPVPREDS